MNKEIGTASIRQITVTASRLRGSQGHRDVGRVGEEPLEVLEGECPDQLAGERVGRPERGDEEHRQRHDVEQDQPRHGRSQQSGDAHAAVPVQRTPCHRRTAARGHGTHISPRSAGPCRPAITGPPARRSGQLDAARPGRHPVLVGDARDVGPPVEALLGRRRPVVDVAPVVLSSAWNWAQWSLFSSEHRTSRWPGPHRSTRRSAR